MISGTLDSLNTDWGDKTTDNDPDDVAVGYSTRSELSGLTGDFTCDATTATCE